jgi:hypothetical protein
MPLNSPRGHHARKARRHRAYIPRKPFGPKVVSIGVIAALGATAAGIAPSLADELGRDSTSPAAATGTTPGNSTVAAEADTYVSQTAPGRSFGTSTKLVAGSLPGDRKVTYLRFSVSAEDLAGAKAVRIRLTRDMHHLPNDVRLHAVGTNGWSETGTTMTDAPEVGRLLGVRHPTRTTNVVTFDVADLVDHPGSYSFAVTSPVTTDVVRFRSREDGDSGPQLELVRDAPVQTPGPTPTSSPTGPKPTPTVTATSTPSPTTPTPSPTPTQTRPTTTPPPGGPLTRPTCAVSVKLVPSCGLWWGAAPRVFTSLSMPEALRQAEADAGRPYDVLHRYHVNDQLFPTAEERAAAAEPGRNRILFENYKPGTDMTWRQIADGRADARIDKLAAHIRTTYLHKFFLAVWHEPENDVNPTAGSGMTAADYAAMFRHTVQRLRAGGVNNAVIVVAYMGYPKWGASAWFDQLYPGDDVVDWVGFDPYGTGSRSGYMSGDFTKLINRTDGLNWEGSYNWAVKEHPSKPVMLAEWGIYEDPTNPGGKAQYYQSVAEQIDRYPKMKALIYFDMPRGPDTGLNTSANSSATALSAYRQLGRDARFVAPTPSVSRIG